MTPENTRALLTEADQILVDLASALPLEDVKAHLPAPSFLHARIGEAREKLADALSLPDTDNRDVRERLFDLIWECDNVEEIVDKLMAAFPPLSRDIAGEIDAERDAEFASAQDHGPEYRNGLARAAEIVRNGR